MDLIGAHPAPFIATDHVAAEITGTFPDQRARYAAALNAAQLTEERVDDPAELEIFLRLAVKGRLGAGDPRSQEFTLQLRAIDADKSGAGLGVAVLTALCGSLLGRNSRGGTIVVGSATLGGSIELVPNAVQVAELAIEKQAQTLLMPVSARRQLNELPDELWTKINVEFYRDVVDAVFKALEE